MAIFPTLVCGWFVICSCFIIIIEQSSAASFTYEVDDIAVLPCNLPVYDTDKYWYYTGGPNRNIRMYLSMNEHVYYSQQFVMERFGRRLTVRNDTDISNRPTYDLIIRNLSFVDIGEYRCGYIGEDRIIRWVHVHHINVSEVGIYDVECALYGPLVPNIGSTVEFYCEIPPQTIYPQKQVELVWYKNNKTLFMSPGLFAPSLAIRLQRTLIESDFGAEFTCVAYDQFYNLKGQCSVSTFHIPINVSVRLLTSQEEISAGNNLSLICLTSGSPDASDRGLQFSWYLESHQIFPATKPSTRDRENDDSDSWFADKNNLMWRFDSGGEILTFTRYHSSLNGSVVVCGIRNRRGITMAVPFVISIPDDPAKVLPSGSYHDNNVNNGGVIMPSKPPFHKDHHFSTFLAVLTFICGLFVSLCLAAVYIILRRRRRRHPGAVDELRWMPIHATVVDHSSVDTFLRRHYFKPPKRLNVQERLNHRPGGEYPISPEHAHQVCLRNKLQDVRRARKSRSVTEDMFNFPLSFDDIPEFRGSKSSALHNLSRSSSLQNFHFDLPGGKTRYVNLPSEYATPVTNLKLLEEERTKPRTISAKDDTDSDLQCIPVPSEAPSTNQIAGKTKVTYAELDMVHLNSIAPAPARTNDAATYAEISHVIPERYNEQNVGNVNVDNSENTSENNFI